MLARAPAKPSCWATGQHSYHGNAGCLTRHSSGIVVAAVIVISLALAGDWLLGGPQRGTRITTSLVTAVRANVEALAIASTTFADGPEEAVAVPSRASSRW